MLKKRQRFVFLALSYALST